MTKIMMQLFTQPIFNEVPQTNINTLNNCMQSTPNNPLACPTPVMPANLAKSPHLWTKDEVGAWLAWCSEEYTIDSVNPERFSMNGRAVCLLNRDDFMQRAPEVGDILYNTLQILIKQSNKNYFPPLAQVHSPVIIMPNSPTLQPPTTHSTPIHTFNGSLLPPLQSTPSLAVSESYIPNIANITNVSSPPSCTDGESVPSESSSVTDNEDMDCQDLQEHDSKENNFETTLESQNGIHSPKRDSDCRLLWEFIYQLLLNKKNSSFICWEDENQYIFRIVNPHGLAELWGAQKSRSTMTYEKLSRALRYYYKMDIIRKVPGKRLTYQFMHPPKDIKKGQRGARPQYKTVAYKRIPMPNTLYGKPLPFSLDNIDDVCQTNQAPHRMMDNRIPENHEPTVDNIAICHKGKPITNNDVLLSSPHKPNTTTLFTDFPSNINGEDPFLKKISLISMENPPKPLNINETRLKYILPKSPDYIKKSSSPNAITSSPSPSLPSLLTNASTSTTTATTTTATPTITTIPPTKVTTDHISATPPETDHKPSEGSMIQSYIHPADIKTEKFYEQFNNINQTMNECHRVTSPNWQLSGITIKKQDEPRHRVTSPNWQLAGITIKEQDEPQDLSMRTLKKHNIVNPESA
ncbi:transcription factor ETV6-like [Argonauta hians]